MENNPKAERQLTFIDNRDFRNWLDYEQRNYHETPDVETMWKIYNLYYHCTCESCAARKRIGVPPIQQIPGCKAPLTSLTHELVDDYIGTHNYIKEDG
jgi:hypothetical protein